MEPPAPSSSRPPALPMEPPALDPEVATLRSRRQKLQAMEVLDFHGVDFVRLRLLRCGRRAYLHAAEDGRSLRLDPRRESHNAVWAVTPHFYADMAIDCVLLRGAYGRYLGAPDPTPRGLRLCPFPSPCRAAKQRDYDSEEVPANLWRAVATSRQGAYLLQDGAERYLRANSRCLLPCCSRLHVSGCAGPLFTATQWAVERVPRAGRAPALPRPTASLFARVCPPLPCLCLCTSEREIRWVSPQPNQAVNEANWTSERYTGRLTIDLKGQLVKQVPPRFYMPDYTLCVRAGRYGELSPLVVNLPRSREPLYIVVLERHTAADNQLIYPDVNAVAGAAAVPEPVL
ncbi:unnamed protein product [Alopecurus aequalis]